MKKLLILLMLVSMGFMWAGAQAEAEDPVRVAFETLRKRLKTEQKIAYGAKARPQQGAF